MTTYHGSISPAARIATTSDIFSCGLSSGCRAAKHVRDGWIFGAGNSDIGEALRRSQLPDKKLDACKQCVHVRNTSKWNA